MTGSQLFLSTVNKISTENISLAELIAAADALKTAGEAQHIGQLYKIWIGLNPTNPVIHAAYFNYGVILSDAGDLEGSKQAHEKAIEHNPDFCPSYINLGNVLERMGKAGEAINLWTAMVNRLNAVSGMSVNYKLTGLKQIGRVLEINKLLPNAEIVLKQSLEIDKNQQDVLQHYVAMRLAQCEWPVLQEWNEVDRTTMLKGTGPLSMAVFTDDPLLQLGVGWSYCRNFIGYPEQSHQDKHNPKKAHKGRLRVGYISSDLRNHAVGFIMAELFELHDRKNVEVFAYYCGIPAEDALKERIRNATEHWVDINAMSDEEAAQRILDDEIDILVDVNGYTKDARTKIFSLKPAPVIVNWLGFPGTMGSPYHHYIIADDWIIPKGHEMYFTEKVMRLPCYQPNDRQRVVADKKPTREEAGLPEDKTVFCSFNGAQKISRFTFARWMEILKRTPDSVLWLLESSEAINDRLRKHAEEHGVDPSRLYFAGKMNNPFHLARYPLADLFLDNLPYGAHVTASDALWMGVPILTLSGRGFAARVCGSLVRSAGLPELVCSSPEEYVERAVQLGSNKAELKKLKKKLKDNRDSCVLFDTKSLTEHLEKLYAQMWDEWRKGKLPVPDMSNCDLYLAASATHDHDAVEMMTVKDYHGFYRDQFAKWHHYSPIRPDMRLWTEEDIARVEKTKPESAAA